MKSNQSKLDRETELKLGACRERKKILNEMFAMTKARVKTKIRRSKARAFVISGGPVEEEVSQTKSKDRTNTDLISKQDVEDIIDHVFSEVQDLIVKGMDLEEKLIKASVAFGKPTV